MGCVSSKPHVIEDDARIPLERTQSTRLSRTSSCREGNTSLMNTSLMNRSDSRSHLIDRKTSIRVNNEDRLEKSRVNPEAEDALANFSSVTLFPKDRESELVAAGWPSWLVSAAAEAVSGWIPRRSDSFERLDKIGEGTYSSVYRARDLIHGKIVALKRVRFDNLDKESVKFMAREILILRRLNHPNVIKLEGLITSNTSTSLYLIFEYMEHDLTGLASLPSLQFTEPQVKCFMQQLLSGLDHCHSRGVLHRDIKGSNLLIDNRGILKIADFGLATFFNPKKSLPLTSRVITLWYRPPELLLGATHYGVAVDLWSAGCILGELYAGKPIMPGRTEVEQLHKIFKLCGSPCEEYWKNSKFPHSAAFKPQRPYPRRLSERFQELSVPALALIETLLSVEPASRGTASSALNSEFFTTEPFACDPSTLPKYPPSKEIDARRREEETKRSQALEEKRDRVDQIKQGSHESAASLSAKVNAEFVSSLQKKRNQCPRQESYRPRRHDSTSGPMFDLNSNRDPHDVKEANKEIFNRLHERGIYSGPLTGGAAGGKGWSHATGEKMMDSSSSFSRLPSLTTRSSLEPSNLPQTRGGFSRNSKKAGPTSDLGRIQKNDSYLNYSDSHHFEDHQTSARKPTLHSYKPEDDSRIHLSGPLPDPSKDLDLMLKQHDLRIQEAARRARFDKFKHGKVLAS